MKLILLRHGESIKNVEDRHGGAGNGLTELGEEQIERFCSVFNRIFGQPTSITCSNTLQVIESATIISKKFGCSFQIDDRLFPLDLGVLSGLSKIEASEQYPDVAQLMESWRKGNIEIRELIIPQAEPLNDFWKRGNSFIKHVVNTEGVHIVIGTRSILTLLISILLYRDIEVGGGYKSIEIPNGAYISFTCLDGRYNINTNFSNLTI